MKKFPWGVIGAASAVMTALIIARCIVTIGRASYYGMSWLPKVQEDPWMLVGILTALICILSIVMMVFLKKEKPNLKHEKSRRK